MKKKFQFKDEEREQHHYRLINAILSSKDEILKELQEVKARLEKLEKPI